MNDPLLTVLRRLVRRALHGPLRDALAETLPGVATAFNARAGYVRRRLGCADRFELVASYPEDVFSLMRRPVAALGDEALERLLAGAHHDICRGADGRFFDPRLDPLPGRCMTVLPLASEDRLEGLLAFAHDGDLRDPTDAAARTLAATLGELLATEEARSRRRLLEEAVDGGGDLLLVSRVEGETGSGRVLVASEGLRRLTGRGPDEAVGRPEGELLASHEALPWERARGHGRDPGRYRTELLAVDGRRLPVEATRRELPEDRDGPRFVTQLRPVPSAPSGASADGADGRFRRVLEEAPVGTALLDRDGGVLHASGGLELLFGVPGETAERHRLERRVHRDDRALLRQGLDACREAPGVRRAVEARVLEPDGSYRRYAFTFEDRLDDPEVEAVVVHARAAASAGAGPGADPGPLAGDREALLTAVDRALRGGVDATLFETVLDHLLAVVGPAQAGSVYRRDEDGRFRVVAVRGFDAEAAAEIVLDAEHVLAQADGDRFLPRLLAWGETHLPEGQSPRVRAAMARAAAGRRIATSLVVPVSRGGDVEAVIYLDRFAPEDAFRREDLIVATFAATNLSAVLGYASLLERDREQVRVRRDLVGGLREALTEEVGEAFFHRLLERAVAAVPGAEAGSVLLADADGSQRFAAAVGFDLEALRPLRFSEERVPRLADGIEVAVTRYPPPPDDGAAELLGAAGRLAEIRSTLVAVIRSEQRVEAVLNLDAFQAGEVFDEEAREVAAGFAKQLEVAVWRRRLERDAERRAGYARLLARLERELLTQTELEPFFPLLAELLLGPGMPADHVGVYRLTSGGRFEPRLFGSPGVSRERLLRDIREAGLLELDRPSLLSRVAAEGRACYVADVRLEPAWRELGHDAIRSILLLPVFRPDGSLWGVFDVASDRPDAFDEDFRELMSQVVSALQLALAQQETRDGARRELAKLRAVVEANDVLRRAHTVDDAFRLAARAVTERTGADGLVLRSAGDGPLTVVAAETAEPGGAGVAEGRRSADAPARAVLRQNRTVRRAGRADGARRAFLGTPIHDREGGPLAVLAAVGRDEQLGDSDRHFLEAIAHAASNAVTRHALLEASAREARSYRALAHFGALIEEINDADRLLELGMAELQRQLGLPFAHFHVSGPEGWRLARTWGEVHPDMVAYWRSNPLVPGKGLLGTAAVSGEVQYVEDYRRWAGKIDSPGNTRVRTVVVLPVRRRGRVAAALALHGEERVTPISSERIAVARNFVRRLENALERTDNLREVEATRESTLRALGLMLEHRDFETKGHTDRVVGLALDFAEVLGLEPEVRRQLRWGAYLHDVGKVAIPDGILLKPGRLEPDEWEAIRRHTVIGAELCGDIRFLPAESLSVVRSHHERWDGSGYPDGLRGAEIPLLARLFSLVDVFDALTSARPYKEAWPVPRALEEIGSQAGRQFDPELTPLFLAMVRRAGA